MRNQLEILTETIILTKFFKEEIHQKQGINFQKLKYYNILNLNKEEYKSIEGPTYISKKKFLMSNNT